MQQPVTSDSKWIVRFRPNPAPRLRLFCFPFAGGGTITYRQWPDSLPNNVEVCAILLPGREKRLREKPFDHIQTMAAAIADSISPLLNEPFAFFGHSMGTMIAFEVARELRRRGQPLPSILFVSGRSAPHLTANPPLYHLPDDQFVAALQARYQQIPQAVIENADLMGLFLPMLRGDFTAIDTYVCQPESPLDCPIVVFGGLRDVIKAEALESWSQHTSKSFDRYMLPGGHFFLNEQRESLLKTVRAYLAVVS